MAELHLTSYLLDNTVSWKRTTLKATLDEMVAGTKWLPKCAMSKSCLRQTIELLVLRGLLWVHRATARSASIYEMNVAWEPVMANRGNGVATPKRKQLSDSVVSGNVISGLFSPWDETPDKASDEVSPEDTTSVARRHTSKEDAFKRKEREENTSYSQPTLQEQNFTSLQPVAIHCETQSALFPVARARIRPIKPVDIVETAIAPKITTKVKSITNDIAWRSAWNVGFPGSPPKMLLPMERGMLAKAQVRIVGMGINWHEFFEWSVTNWRHVMTEKFSWMTKKPSPAYPEIQFLCTLKFMNAFLEAWACRKEHDEHQNSEGEAGLLRKLTASGMSHEQAIYEMGRRKGQIIGRAKDHAASAEISQQARIVEVAKASLEVERREFFRQQAQAKSAKVATRPTIDHGNNPFENPDAAGEIDKIAEITFGAWDE